MKVGGSRFGVTVACAGFDIFKGDMLIPDYSNVLTEAAR